MRSPLLGLQKPWQRDQGKRYQKEALLEPPVVAAAAQHVGAAKAPCRSGCAWVAGQPGGGRRHRIGAGPGEGVEGSASTVGSVGEGSASTVGSEGEGSASTVGSEEEGSASTVGSEGVEEPGIGSLPDPPLHGGQERGQPCGSTLPPACGCAGGVMGQEENGEVTPTAQLTWVANCIYVAVWVPR